MKTILISTITGILYMSSIDAATVVGTKLNIGTSNTISGTSSATIGLNNDVWQNHSLAIGIHNFVYDDDNEHASLAFGRYNTLSGMGSIVGGQYNISSKNFNLTVGSYNFNSASCSIVGGTGHTLGSSSAYADGMVVGRYSAPISVNKPAHLVLGNGTGASQRNNSLVVYADGDIVISKPQGDVSMGIYE